MKVNTKVPAFTLLEITVAMLIAAIAIGITYIAFHIVNGTYHNYQRLQEQHATLELIDKLLKHDFEQAEQIKRTDDGLQLSSKSGMINYAFTPGYVLRNQFSLQTDTFKIPVVASTYYFEKGLAAEHSLVDELFLDTGLEAESFSLSYQKTYSATTLFN